MLAYFVLFYSPSRWWERGREWLKAQFGLLQSCDFNTLPVYPTAPFTHACAHARTHAHTRTLPWLAWNLRSLHAGIKGMYYHNWLKSLFNLQREDNLTNWPMRFLLRNTEDKWCRDHTYSDSLSDVWFDESLPTKKAGKQDAWWSGDCSFLRKKSLILKSSSLVLKHQDSKENILFSPESWRLKFLNKLLLEIHKNKPKSNNHTRTRTLNLYPVYLWSGKMEQETK